MTEPLLEVETIINNETNEATNDANTAYITIDLARETLNELVVNTNMTKIRNCVSIMDTVPLSIPAVSTNIDPLLSTIDEIVDETVDETGDEIEEENNKENK